MWIFSFLCIAIGIYPDPLYAILPYAVDYQPYTIDHLVTQLQLLLFAGFAFFVMLRMMKRTLTISLDFDWFYRKFFKELTEEFSIHASVAQKNMERRITNRIESIILNLYRHHGPTGILSRVLPTGSMVMWVAILLCLYLLSYYY
jgi:multicomponent Na+:H+ antiporter subunit D